MKVLISLISASVGMFVVTLLPPHLEFIVAFVSGSISMGIVQIYDEYKKH